MAISPDRRTLYSGGANVPTALQAFDVSSDTPVVQWDGGLGYQLQGLPLSHDGAIIVPAAFDESRPKLPTSDLGKPTGQFILPDATRNLDDRPQGPIAFSPNDKTLFMLHGNEGEQLDLFDVATTEYLRTIPVEEPVAYDLVVDGSGQFVFISSGRNPLLVYGTGEGISFHPPKPQSLLNVSTRLFTSNGTDGLVGGFIISGTQAKEVAIRALGPSLPVTGNLADPKIELFNSSGELVKSNDSWNTSRSTILAAGLAPGDEHEAAMVVTLPPGAYTAEVVSSDGGSGVALLEVFDLTPDTDSALANISTRGHVDSGDNVMIGGFIISPDESTKVLIRAIGPSLAQRGIADPLLDPVLELHDGQGNLILKNDDWRSTQAATIQATGIPPTDPRESAIVAALPAGNYTAIVSGKNGNSGVALVEVYNLSLTN